MKSLTVNVNAYQVTIPNLLIRHYDVEIRQKDDSETRPKSEPSLKFNHRVIQHLQNVIDSVTFDPPVAFDGRRNMFATRILPLGSDHSASYSFTLEPPDPNSRQPPTVYDVKIKNIPMI